MDSAVFHTGCRFCILFIICAGYLVGVSVFAETPGLDRFVLALDGYKLSINSQLKFDSPGRRPVAILDKKEDLQAAESPAPTQFDVNPDFTQQIPLKGNSNEPDRLAVTELAGLEMPLPMDDPYLGWNLTTKLKLTLTGDDPSTRYGDSGGTIVGLRLSLRYRVLENVGIGVGYDVLDVNSASNASSSGLVNYRQWGPMAFMSLQF